MSSPVRFFFSTPKLIVLAAAIHLCAAWFSEGRYHDDEHHQLLEFAAFKLGLKPPETLAWEFGDKARSALQPAIAYVTAESLATVGINSPFIWAFVLRLLSAALALTAVLLFIRATVGEIRDETLWRWFVILSLFTWSVVYTHVRFSAENWAVSFFFAGFALYYLGVGKSTARALLIGAMFGLAFVARYQTGIMLASFFLWLMVIRRENFRTVVVMMSGGAFVCALGILLDRWLYGEWVLSAWNYFYFHFIGNGSGPVNPEWYFYLEKLITHTLPPISILFLPAIVAFGVCFPRHPLTWITLPYLVFHLVFENQQTRYLIPIMTAIPLILILMHERILVPHLAVGRRRKMFTAVFASSWVLNLAMLAVFATTSFDRHASMQSQVYALHRQIDTTTLLYYYAGSKRSQRAFRTNFYTPPTMSVARIESLLDIQDFIDDDKPILLASFRRDISAELSDAGFDSALIWTSVPAWMLAIDVNQWTSRASIWRLYQINAATSAQTAPPRSQRQTDEIAATVR